MINRLIFAFILMIVSVSSFAATETVRTTPLPGTVALTFDDGPNPIYTQEILAILKKYNIKATFFMVGINVIRFPAMVQLVNAEGHVVASHTMTNPMLTQLDDKQLLKEIKMPSILIHSIINKYPLCLRYPFGDSNEHVREVVLKNGMQTVPAGWNSYDSDLPGVDKIVAQVMKGVESGQVILLHDGYDNRQQTVDALPKIIEAIQKKGLGFSQICVNSA